jgi:uncharacterized membrane protein YdjX (TVP38/TMEM64 family)
MESLDHNRTICFVGHGVLAVVVLVLLWWVGRHVADEIKLLEEWIESLGIWGPVVFVLAAVVLTSVFVPESLLAVVAGLSFGLVWGTVITFVAATITAALDFLLAQWLLRKAITRALERYPKLKAIQTAANREGIRLLLLLRLAPINPVTVSYLLGAGGARFVRFIIASVGLIPVQVMEVYFGQTAKHLAQLSANPEAHSAARTAMTIGGLLVCAVLTFFIGRIAKKALAEAEAAA